MAGTDNIEQSGQKEPKQISGFARDTARLLIATCGGVAGKPLLKIAIGMVVAVAMAMNPVMGFIGTLASAANNVDDAMEVAEFIVEAPERANKFSRFLGRDKTQTPKERMDKFVRDAGDVDPAASEHAKRILEANRREHFRSVAQRSRRPRRVEPVARRRPQSTKASSRTLASGTTA